MKAEKTSRAGRRLPARARRARRQTPDWWPACRKTLRPGLERDTQLMPWVPRPWDARRVLEHRRWAWLGSTPGIGLESLPYT